MRRALALAGLVLAAGCGALIDADPMPSPIDPTQTIVSTSDALRDGSGTRQVGVIGLQNATEGAGFVEITNPATAMTTLVSSSADGSFVAMVPSAAGDQLQFVFRRTRNGAGSKPVTVYVNVPSSAAGTPGTPADGNYGGAGSTNDPGTEHASAVVWASAPDAQGYATLTGQYLTVGNTVAFGDTRNSAVLQLVVAADTTDPTKSGVVAGKMPAHVGDTVVVIVTNPGAPHIPSLALSITVPAY